ncbi:histone-lysine N-methyltransferase SUVR5 isoform X2 [Tasmannia lanceolata]|uniref:histone-lysine N-methyltransferase SUVR5 isoform X2 n=1 Tax=Tasmannia lanceolata TaxID=3420 RepID=UPI0040632992
MPGDNQSNEYHGEHALPKFDCALQGPRDGILNGTNAGEETLQKVDFLKNWEGDELSNNICEIKARSRRTDYTHQVGCDLSMGTCQGEDTLPKEEDISKKDGQPTNLMYNGEPESHKQGVQVSDGIPKVDESLLNIKAQRNEANDDKPTSENFHAVTSDFQHREREALPSNFHEPSEYLPQANEGDLGNLEVQKQNGEPSDSYPFIHKVETELLNGKHEGEAYHLEVESPEQDDTVALWVKWRGKWQPGIRCSRADWPLSTLKAKPTHGRKKYFVVFFPHTRSHSWADMLLVRPINELPEPLAYGSHYSALELVKDLTTPRRYIMQKLAVAMLNISDQLHTEAVIERARKVTAWKDFAMEACRCEGYSDLGSMLLKLQSMILPTYIDSDWLEHSFGSWVHHCQIARSAESVETLTKELVDSVMWNEVEVLWDAPVQPNLGSEWKTWKQEVMKSFSTSHPVGSSGDSEQRNFDDAASVGPQISRKRPKLEVRRPEMHRSRVEAEVCGPDSGFLNCQPIENATMECEPSKDGSLTMLAAATGYLGSVADTWDEIVVESRNHEFNQTVEEASTPVQGGNDGKSLVDVQQGSHSENKYRQCMAFIEAKGRQCGRWANDGDIYCCVHLSTRFADKTAKLEQSPSFTGSMCEGTTTHGTRCKHRSRNGSSFCKKHRIQGSDDLANGDMSSISPANMLKRKHSEKRDSFEKTHELEVVSGKEIVLVGFQNPAQEDLRLVTEREPLEENNSLMVKPEHSGESAKGYCQDLPRCIIWCWQNNSQCLERAKTHSLYCEKHLPAFLKRARNGKSRLISKDVFLDLLRTCSSRQQKVHLHRACELLYGFMKSALSRRNLVSKESLMGWILSEASKDSSTGEFLLKVVSCEKEKIGKLWGFDAEKDKQISEPVLMLEAKANKQDVQSPQTIIKCKICTEEFPDDQALGSHWMDIHKKEAQWLFRGYACAICMNSFTNRKVLEKHAKERHSIQFLDQCLLFQCMPCGSHFVNPEQLWLHVLSLHSMDFRLRTNSEQLNQSGNQAPPPKLELGNNAYSSNDAKDNHSKSPDLSRRYICRFCGLKFDLLPDLGRHHQAAHMNSNSSHFPIRRRNRLNASKLKHGRPGRPRLKKGFGAALRIRNSDGFGVKKLFRTPNLVSSAPLPLQTQAIETAGLERFVESDCSAVAEILFAEIQRSKARPSNLEILSIARSTCCKIRLQGALEEKYGVLPERLYLKAAKLCSELNIQVEWHMDGFICPKGCKPLVGPNSLAPLVPLPDGFIEPASVASPNFMNGKEWEMDEGHYISRHFKRKPMQKAIVLCKDVSFGRESVPVACVIDEDLKDSLNFITDKESNGQNPCSSMPWEGFTYVTKRLLDPSLGLDTELGCACPHPSCHPETCDHVYLFDNDYENAEDIHGKPMHGRFPYNEKGQIILEEGYLVYECNSMCKCDKTCRNRVLQNGVQVKLEVFKTENKGWAVRAGEAIQRGTFVCEYIGEVLNDQEANSRGERYDNEGCSYLYDIDAHLDDMSGLNEGTVPYVIDATKYGNVSRFINHSCAPNLVNYQVLVESMDCQLAHIGLYAGRDVAKGEELAYDYRYKLLPGDGHPCRCGASNCRGRLY